MEPIINEHYTLEVGTKEGEMFISFQSDMFPLSAIKSLKNDVQKIHEYAAQNGHDLVFAHTQDEKFIALWNRVRPCYDVVSPEPGHWVGAWEVGE